MTKTKLIEDVKKKCSEDNISKRLAEDVLNAAFENIRKIIKKNKRFSYPGFGTFTVRNIKQGLVEILKPVTKYKFTQARLLVLKPHQN